MVTPPTVEVASLGMADSLILMVMALVVFGPRRLPQIGRQLGKLMYEFRKASNDFKFQMEEELRISEEADRRKQEEERQKALALNAPAADANATTDATATNEEPAAVNAIESPYPGEGTYPSETTPASEPFPSEPAPAEPAEKPGLRIQPPSTGETVAASRPTGAAKPASEPANEPAPEAPKPKAQKTRAQKTRAPKIETAATEPAPVEATTPTDVTAEHPAAEKTDPAPEAMSHNG